MITRRSLLFLSFPLLLSGCYNFYNPCADPDAISERWVPQCFYHLRVLDTDPSTSTVNAQYVGDYRQDKTKPMPSFTFHVRDLDHLKIQKNKEYYFIRQGSSPFLEPFSGTPKGVEYPEGNQDSAKAGK